MTPDALDPARLEDGDLVRLLDGETEGVASSALATSDRFRRLQSASQRFDAAVAEIPVPDLPPAPDFERRPARWGGRRAAAVVVLAGAAAIAVSPLGASIAREVRELVARMGLVEPSAPPASEYGPRGGAAVVSGVVTAPALTVEVRPAGATGTLTLERVEGSLMSAVAGAGSAAELIFSSSGLVIDGAGEREQLLVRIPASVREVVVRVGGRPERTFASTPDDPPLVIPLAQG